MEIRPTIDALQSRVMQLAPGACPGPYELVSLAGPRGMGEVYRASDSRIARDVAIKILHGELSRFDARYQPLEPDAHPRGPAAEPRP